MSTQWMIYGANGYTGRLTAALAVERGETPILAGRSAEKVEPLAAELGLASRIVDLRDEEALVEALADVDAVFHAAGPFSQTSAPMVAACLRSGTHYLDVTGEIEVFEAVFARGDDAREAGVALLPGVGVDVVPTDCLAAMLKARLPDANTLELSFYMGAGSSAGTTKTMVEALPMGAAVRRAGHIERVPYGWKRREIPFADRARVGVIAPWGDVCTAYHSTGIADIYVYMPFPPKQLKWLPLLNKTRWMLRPSLVQRALKRLVGWRVKGPDATERAESHTQFWGEVRNDRGDRVAGTMTGPNGYTLTADASLRAVRRVLEVPPTPGAHTPSMAFGADFVRELDGIEVHLGEGE